MILKEIWQYRAMISSLVYRDLHGRYKGSVLGFLWTFINPLLQLLVYSIVFSVIMRMGIEKYGLFLFVALIPWIFLSSSIVNGSNCIIDNSNLVCKIYFPREVLPIAVVNSNFINMLYSFIIVIGAVLIYGDNHVYINWLYLPLLFITEYVIVLGVTLIVAALTVYIRDLAHILNILVFAWQFLTPVLYPLSMVPEQYQYLFEFNPMTNIIVAYRDILFYNAAPDILVILKAFVYGVILMVLGFVIFGKLKKGFAENL